MKNILIDYMKAFTDLSDSELDKIVNLIPIEDFKGGDVLIHQGEVPTKCYFVLKGCVRQYSVNEKGDETTFNFFIEEESVTIFNQHKQDKQSKYTLVCLEDSILVVGDLSNEQTMYDDYPFLADLTRKMMEEDLGALSDRFASFIASSPEERYKVLIEERPGLAERVPQHQLASYLGIKPESLSRLKRRLEQKHLKLVN